MMETTGFSYQRNKGHRLRDDKVIVDGLVAWGNSKYKKTRHNNVTCKIVINICEMAIDEVTHCPIFKKCHVLWDIFKKSSDTV